ncbi:MAG TPA: hypothetical protein VK897_13085 [Anaerolineales bacterium]|nr:hypothetical protein [Anaerolineales bacterium]
MKPNKLLNCLQGVRTPSLRAAVLPSRPWGPPEEGRAGAASAFAGGVHVEDPARRGCVRRLWTIPNSLEPQDYQSAQQHIS